MGMESARWYCITCELFTLHHNTIALYLIAMYKNMHLGFSSLLVSSYSKWMYFSCMHVLGFIKSVESLALLSANTNRHTLERSDRNSKDSSEIFIYPVRCSLHLTEVHRSVFSFLLYTWRLGPGSCSCSLKEKTKKKLGETSSLLDLPITDLAFIPTVFI